MNLEHFVFSFNLLEVKVGRTHCSLRQKTANLELSPRFHCRLVLQDNKRQNRDSKQTYCRPDQFLKGRPTIK